MSNREIILAKQALESVSQPVKKNAGLFVKVLRFFTDINGTVLDKNDPAIPALTKTFFPFWMFGQFDREGGYKIGNQVTPPDLNTPYLGTFTNGLGMPFLFANPLNDIKQRLSLGDIIHIFTDDLNNPSVYIWIVQHNDFSALGSVYSNALSSEFEKILIESVNYFVYSNGQFNSNFAMNINYTQADVVGAYVNKPLDPLGFDKTEYPNFQQNFINVPLKFEVNQYAMVSSKIAFDVDSLQFSFIIKKNTVPMFGMEMPDGTQLEPATIIDKNSFRGYREIQPID